MLRIRKSLLLLSFIPILYTIIRICWIVGIRHKISNSYHLKSNEINIRYDNIQRRKFVFEFQNKIKLSSNSFDSNVFRYKLDNDFDPNYEKINATILMLVRNEELEGALDSMRQLEDRFNRRYHYDWVFLNDVPFTPEFKEATTFMASGDAQYALIPPEDWNCPSSINQTQFEINLAQMQDDGVLYGNSKSYRNMCRFNSGYFFRQKILDQYDYYFRVEPNVKYFCDFPYDPFKIMEQRKLKYGWVIGLYEYENTIETLWDTVAEYIKFDQDKSITNRDINMSTNAYNFITDKSQIGEFGPVTGSNSDYNLCHFWSNFEIGDLNFFRSDKYIKFFEYLDQSGGFYYERWGDAPVHSIAVSLLLNKDEIIHFDEIGYAHAPFNTCPISDIGLLSHRCRCQDSTDNIAIDKHSCLMRWWKNGSGKFFMQEDNYIES
ncbi:probable mannosyltransferase Yur1p [Monosporozyma unispora]|nr:mannosyltransferase yur1 [Kazachstania unispora]